MEEELLEATQEYDTLMRSYSQAMSLAAKHMLRTENLRKRVLMARDAKRAIERDILSAPIISMYVKGN